MRILQRGCQNCVLTKNMTTTFKNKDVNIPFFVCLSFIWLVFGVKLSSLQQAIPRCIKLRLLFMFLIMQYSTANRNLCVYHLAKSSGCLCQPIFFFQKEAAKMLPVGKNELCCK